VEPALRKTTLWVPAARLRTEATVWQTGSISVPSPSCVPEPWLAPSIVYEKAPRSALRPAQKSKPVPPNVKENVAAGSLVQDWVPSTRLALPSSAWVQSPAKVSCESSTAARAFFRDREISIAQTDAWKTF
jgi:hypothetical protein